MTATTNGTATPAPAPTGRTTEQQNRDLSRATGTVENTGSSMTSLQGMVEEMDRFFNNSPWRYRWMESPFSTTPGRIWPQIEIVEQDGTLSVRADLPGMKKEDVTVEVVDNVLVLKGERRHEEEERKDGFYRSERSYGSFYRTIPIPEGAGEAEATFREGVLEVRMAVPQHQPQTRTIEIAD